ncbi:hypothetical protein [Flavobacterium sp. SM2513]|uniref:hypothetical protein n=1 Tax=Flavobacterium sp. SM2513 TaxID=3424766 RepID=UPI003D7FB8E3
MNDMVLQPSPIDGIIATTKDNKYVYLYDYKSKTFDKFYQYSNQDIKDYQEEEQRAQDTESYEEE